MALTEAAKSQVSAFYAQGKSIYQVHLETGLDQRAIRAHLKDTGQTRQPGSGKPPTFSSQQCARIARLRVDGMSWAALSKRFGVCVETIKRADEWHRTGEVRMRA